MKPTPGAVKTCGTCLLHSRRDACCALTGESRRKGDKACCEWTDGKTMKRGYGQGAIESVTKEKPKGE